jgi:hypothetical protein
MEFIISLLYLSVRAWMERRDEREKQRERGREKLKKKFKQSEFKYIF